MNSKARHAPLAGVVLVGIWTLPALALAPEHALESRLRICVAIDHDGQRLACYDQLLESEEGVPHPARAGEAHRTAVDPDPTGVPAPAVTKQDRPDEDAVEEVPVAGRDPEPPPAAPPSAPATKNEPAPADTFGLKQPPPREAAPRAVRVTGIRKDLTGHFVFTLQDGQIWRQIDRRRVHYDEVPFDAEIRNAALASFFLKPTAGSVSIKVRREK